MFATQADLVIKKKHFESNVQIRIDTKTEIVKSVKLCQARLD